MNPTTMRLLLLGTGMLLLPSGQCQCVSVTFPNVLNLGTCLGAGMTNCANSTEETSQNIGRLYTCLLSTLPEIGSPIGVLSNLDVLMELVYSNLGIPLDVESLANVLCSPLGFPLFECGSSALNFNNLTCGPPIQISLPESFNVTQCVNRTLLSCTTGSQFPASSLSEVLRTFQCVLGGAPTELQRNLSRMLVCPLMDVLSSSVGQFFQLLPFRSVSRGISTSMGWLMGRLAADSCPLQARQTSLSLLGFGRRSPDGLTPTWARRTGIGGAFGARPQIPQVMNEQTAFGSGMSFQPPFMADQFISVPGIPGSPGAGRRLPFAPVLASGSGLGGPLGMRRLMPSFPQNGNFGGMPGISGNGLPGMAPHPSVVGGGEIGGILGLSGSGGGGWSPSPPPQSSRGAGVLAMTGTIQSPIGEMSSQSRGGSQGVGNQPLPAESSQLGLSQLPQLTGGGRVNTPWQGGQAGQGGQQGKMIQRPSRPFSGLMEGLPNPVITPGVGGMPQVSLKYQGDPNNGMPWPTSHEGTAVISQQPSQPQDGKYGGLFDPRPGTSHDPAPPIGYQSRKIPYSGSRGIVEGMLPSSQGDIFVGG